VNFRQRSDGQTIRLHYQWGGFQIRNVNFRERLDGRSHENYHSVGLAQARPNNKDRNIPTVEFDGGIIILDTL